ncbi:MAG: hypothetical protein A2Y20_06495 [Firmicutes bacterium GWF2_51_9]|nr:MAG: hypothetical protein A2Y20_06495 [Firmicutes bacterium GWF2_51_9]OGS59753.1 MAG: hypothetical protein A2Y19_06885 [Firmicutes bacterium GWE2_51_13]HAM62263.1 hypothetical protein [Erysipelotrichaceae bacterium]HBZ42359.1 hypothetical protein [Erysipelotrichaceae bacterium]
MKKRLNKKGFTLIELIVVIAILAILAAILIPALTNYIQKATDAKNQANCRSLYTQYSLDVAVAPAGATVADPTLDGATIVADYASGAVTEFSCTFTTPGGVYSMPLFTKVAN